MFQTDQSKFQYISKPHVIHKWNVPCLVIKISFSCTVEYGITPKQVHLPQLEMLCFCLRCWRYYDQSIAASHFPIWLDTSNKEAKHNKSNTASSSIFSVAYSMWKGICSCSCKRTLWLGDNVKIAGKWFNDFLTVTDKLFLLFVSVLQIQVWICKACLWMLIVKTYLVIRSSI